MLKDSIIERIRDFFSSGFNQKGWIIDEKYNTEVLNLNSSPLYASLSWLKNMNVIDDKDVEEFEGIKNCRNELVHEMNNFVSRGPRCDPLALFSKMIDLLQKIEKWWILNVEIAADPDLHDKNIDGDGIVPGPIMTLRLLSDIALGTEEESKFYFNEFKKRKDSI